MGHNMGTILAKYHEIFTISLSHYQFQFSLLTWAALCWVFKDNYKARFETSPDSQGTTNVVLYDALLTPHN